MDRRLVTKRLVAVGILGAGSLGAHLTRAQSAFPNRPLRLIVGFAAGGPTDQAARIVAEAMGNSLGQPIVIENRPGANSAIAVRAFAAGKPDGYTLILASNGILTVAEARYKKLPYDVRSDFVPVGSVAGYSHVLTVPADSPCRDLQALVSRAKTNALNMASVGQVDELSIALLRKLSGAQFTNVPYPGQSAVMSDLIAGRIDLSFLAPTVAASMIQSGKLRAVAVSGKSRLAGFPDIPTMQEAGLPGFDVEIWNALMAPPGTDPGVLDILGKSLRQVLGQASVQKKLAVSGLVPLIDAPQELTQKIDAEGKKWKALAKEERLPLLDF